MFHCYILYSKKLDKFYVGATTNIEERIKSHNSAKYGSRAFTAKATDWIVVLAIESKDFGHALRLETKIKSMKSKTYIKNLIKYPEMISKIYKETLDK